MKSVKPVSKNRTTKSPKKVNQKQQFPLLRFTPYAWAKLLFLRDYGESEVGGFGITSADDLLLVEDIQLTQQECTTVTVKFDDISVADFFDNQVDQNRQPEQFGRIWIYTHPDISAAPSIVDEETFARSFGRVDWAIMFILAKGGETYARMRFNVGPGGEAMLPVQVDCNTHFPASDQVAWEEEYLQHVIIEDDWVFAQQPFHPIFDPYGFQQDKSYPSIDEIDDDNEFDMTGFVDDFYYEQEQEEPI